MADFNITSPTSFQTESLAIQDYNVDLTVTQKDFSASPIGIRTFGANAGLFALLPHTAIQFSSQQPKNLSQIGSGDSSRRPLKGQIYPRGV
jgi:hypothetical protein